MKYFFIFFLGRWADGFDFEAIGPRVLKLSFGVVVDCWEIENSEEIKLQGSWLQSLQYRTSSHVIPAKASAKMKLQ